MARSREFRRVFGVVCILVWFSGVASALTIDTSARWTGSVNSGWLGSGQSLTINPNYDTLDSLTFYFDPASFGQTFSLSITDALVGGNIFYSTAFSAAASNSFSINSTLTPNSTVYALIDYNGFTGKSAHIIHQNGWYPGGNSYFYDSYYPWTSYPSIDHSFTAIFSGVGGPAPIPLPAGGVLLVAGLGALFLLRRRGNDQSA